MYRSETGGVCDCGDFESWAEEGCCRAHAPRRSRESKTSLGEDGTAAADVDANTAGTANGTLPPLPRREAAEAVIGVVAERLLLALESVARARGGFFFVFCFFSVTHFIVSKRPPPSRCPHLGYTSDSVRAHSMTANASDAWCGDEQRIKSTRKPPFALVKGTRDAKKWREISIIYFTSTKRVTTVRENENDPPIFF